MTTAGETKDPAGQGNAFTSVEGPVGLVRLREASDPVGLDVAASALAAFDRDPAVRCMVVSGSAAEFFTGPGSAEGWDRLRRLSKPVVAAVTGPATGPGFELALACDIVVAAETAVFGQAEPFGAGRSGGMAQRLTRGVGKAMAMDILLTGRSLTAREALLRGLASRVVPAESCLDESMNLAREIAGKPITTVTSTKEAVSRALDMDLETGLAYERRLCELLSLTSPTGMSPASPAGRQVVEGAERRRI